MERLKVGGRTQAQVDAERQAEEQRTASDEARAYLRETDWYVIRYAELGTKGTIPDEIRTKRNAARNTIVEEHRE